MVLGGEMVIFLDLRAAPKDLHNPKVAHSGVSNAPKMSFWVYTALVWERLKFNVR